MISVAYDNETIYDAAIRLYGNINGVSELLGNTEHLDTPLSGTITYQPKVFQKFVSPNQPVEKTVKLSHTIRNDQSIYDLACQLTGKIDGISDILKYYNSLDDSLNEMVINIDKKTDPVLNEIISKSYVFSTKGKVLDISTFSELETFLTNSGLWSKHDLFVNSIGWNAAEQSTFEYRRNQINDVLATESGSLIWSNLTGYTPNNGASSLKLNFNPLDDGGNYLNTSRGVWFYFSYLGNINIFQRNIIGNSQNYIVRTGSDNEFYQSETPNLGDQTFSWRNNYPIANITGITPQQSGLVYFGYNGVEYNTYAFGSYSSGNKVITPVSLISEDWELFLPVGFFYLSDIVAMHGICSYLTESELQLLDSSLTSYYDNVNA